MSLADVPNEITYNIYQLLPINDRFRFASTCKVFRSFEPAGYSIWLNRLRAVSAEIKQIYYNIDENGKQSNRKYLGWTTGYTFQNIGTLSVCQGFAPGAATLAQSRRYNSITSIKRIDSVPARLALNIGNISTQVHTSYENFAYNSTDKVRVFMEILNVWVPGAEN